MDDLVIILFTLVVGNLIGNLLGWWTFRLWRKRQDR